ncbi:hypothetical protein [Metallosphaera hakonensis]|uniref:hypothetical protein n=1 Tax=Metallosphaera hakonensis TaxID=79601 RepID=UPI000A960BB7|nr:hypothetical protein [Metallosphaera hakonensis]
MIGFLIRSPQAFSTYFLEGVELSLVSSMTAAVIDVLAFTPLAYYLSRVGIP